MADPVRKQPAGGVLDDDPFFYGSRWISVRLPDGRLVDQEIPLTPDDLLDPQLGDQVTQSNRHSKMARRLIDLLEEHFDSRQDVHIVNDLKMLWGIRSSLSRHQTSRSSRASGAMTRTGTASTSSERGLAPA
jgi:hypothetical protein